jgi:hypothetical protein
MLRTKNGTNGTTSTDERSLISIPRTPAEFKPPQASSMILEMASLLRNEDHWAQVLPYIDAIAGTGPSICGSPKFDEAGLIFKLKDISSHNGCPLLANLTPAQLSPIVKRALFRNTGERMRALQKQAIMLRLEAK